MFDHVSVNLCSCFLFYFKYVQKRRSGSFISTILLMKKLWINEKDAAPDRSPSVPYLSCLMDLQKAAASSCLILPVVFSGLQFFSAHDSSDKRTVCRPTHPEKRLSSLTYFSASLLCSSNRNLKSCEPLSCSMIHALNSDSLHFIRQSCFLYVKLYHL